MQAKWLATQTQSTEANVKHHIDARLEEEGIKTERKFRELQKCVEQLTAVVQKSGGSGSAVPGTAGASGPVTAVVAGLAQPSPAVAGSGGVDPAATGIAPEGFARCGELHYLLCFTRG